MARTCQMMNMEGAVHSVNPVAKPPPVLCELNCIVSMFLLIYQISLLFNVCFNHLISKWLHGKICFEKGLHGFISELKNLLCGISHNTNTFIFYLEICQIKQFTQLFHLSNLYPVMFYMIALQDPPFILQLGCVKYSWNHKLCDNFKF